MSIQQTQTQVLVLGAGPGGYSAAFRCADLGLHTTIVERHSRLGGVCLNTGCIPSKTLLYIAKLIQTHKILNKYGIYTKTDHVSININKICSWKTNIIQRISQNLSSMAKARNIEVINGFGKFIDNHTLTVSNNQISSEITFNQAIIATGSHPIVLSCMPNDDQRIWDSSDALSLKSVPQKLLIIGSGAIGLEMATIYHALGSKVDIVETHNQILPFLDQDIVQCFYKNIKKNITFITNTTIYTAESKQDGIYVIMKNHTNSNIKYTNRYDAILIAIGRTPNTHILNLENTKININKSGFIIVDKQMRTNESHIFAIGDVIGHPMLAHKSIYEGHIVAEVIAGKKYYFDSKIIPSIIYSDPEIAWVGYTEKNAQSKHINYETAIFPWTALGKAIASDCTEGMTKLIFDKKTNRIIGGLILGSHASEMIGEIALAIEMGCDAEDISLTMHAHPTLYESIALASSIYNKSITDLIINVKK